MRTAEQSTATRPPHDGAPEPSLLWFSTVQIADLGVAVHDSGLDAHPRLVQELAGAGSRVAPDAAAVLASASEPTVARERALAVVSAALVRARSTSREGRATGRAPEG